MILALLNLILLLAIVAAVIWTYWKLMRLERRVKRMSLVDTKEFASLKPEIRDHYKKFVVDRIAPALGKVANESWDKHKPDTPTIEKSVDDFVKSLTSEQSIKRLIGGGGKEADLEGYVDYMPNASYLTRH